MTRNPVEELLAAARRVGRRRAEAEPAVPPPGPSARDEVRRRRAEATEAWAATMGDATSCALAKDGRSYPAGKYHEGRVAALGELMRRLDPGTDAAGAAVVARELSVDWVARVLPGGGENRDWESYRAGAVHALAEFAGG
jgi:hypothetical protein